MQSQEADGNGDGDLVHPDVNSPTQKHNQQQKHETLPTLPDTVTHPGPSSSSNSLDQVHDSLDLENSLSGGRASILSGGLASNRSSSEVWRWSETDDEGNGTNNQDNWDANSTFLLDRNQGEDARGASAWNENEAEEAPILPGASHQPPNLTAFQLAGLNAFWFGYQFMWFLMGIVIVPSQVQQIVGEADKGKGLATTALLSGLVNMFWSVLIGAFNDRFSSRFGRRRPWMAAGSVSICLTLFLLWASDPFWLYNIGYLLFTLATVLASVPFNGLVADLSSAEQKGSVSAVMGFFNLAGYLAGAIVGTFAESIGVFGLYVLICLVLLSTTSITIWCTIEPPSHYQKQVQHSPVIRWKDFLADMIRPLVRNRDFRLVFLGRFLFQLGISTVQQFLQYWIGDCIATNLPHTQAVSLALIPLLVLSPIGALFIPRTRRKIVVYISTVFMVSSCLAMFVVHDFTSTFVVSSLFGLGFGPFLSVEFAMLMDVLPSEEDAARDISIWHSALVLPQIVALPIAGWLRDGFQAIGDRHGVHCLGYKVIDFVCLVYFILGAWITHKIRGVK